MILDETDDQRHRSALNVRHCPSPELTASYIVLLETR
jgi:hypothetical protein